MWSVRGRSHLVPVLFSMCSVNIFQATPCSLQPPWTNDHLHELRPRSSVSHARELFDKSDSWIVVVCALLADQEEAAKTRRHVRP